ncbi:MAG TPA: DUF1835 domain-containing protein [Ferruginibacter sp.]|nr:DUF1835 domain-containing protein [Ferruginibacter sp.]
MIHIVFNEADVPLLKEAITMDDSLAGEVLLIKDDYAVGPLDGIYAAPGLAERREWWRQVLDGGDYAGKVESGDVDDVSTVNEIRAKLLQNESEVVWIWAAQNSHDVCGYYWLLHYVKEFQNRIFILYLNNLPFFNDKGQIFYPNWLHQIPAKEFLKAKRMAREITLSEFEVDTDEWNKICRENRMVRRLEGGKKIVQQDADFFDSELKKYISKDWQKASKIIHQYLHKANDITGDAYLLWRLKTLIASGSFDVQGKLETMKDFEVKTQTVVTA